MAGLVNNNATTLIMDDLLTLDDLSPIDKSHLMCHLKLRTQWLQEALLPYGLRVHEPPESQYDNNVAASAADNDGVLKDAVYEEQVKALGEILKCFIHKDEFGRWTFRRNHIAIEALTQSGKTMLMMVGCFLPLWIAMITKSLNIYVAVLVDERGLENQAEAALESFFSIYGGYCFSRVGVGQKKMNINDYMQMIRKQVKELDEIFPKQGKLFRSSLSSSGKVAFQKLKAICKKARIGIIAVNDESHYRSGSALGTRPRKGSEPQDSVLSQFYNEDLDRDSEKINEEFSVSHEKWLKNEICFIGLSATNYALVASFRAKGYPCVKMYPGKGHVNYGWLSGERVEGITPEVLSLEEMYRMVDAVPGIEFNLPYRVFKNTKGVFETNGVKPVVYRDFSKYDIRSKWIEDFAAIVRFLMLEKNPIGSMGMLVRVVVKNGKVEDIIKDLDLPEFQLIFHKGGKKMSMEEQIDKECGKIRTKPYVVFVTGLGRMGSVAPKDCLIGIEFAENENPQTMEQAIAGRMTGYKGKPLVILADSNARMLKNYIKTGRWENEKGDPVSPYKPHVLVVESDGYTRGMNFEFSGISAELRAEIKKVIKPLYKDTRTKKGGIGNARTFTGDVFPYSLYQKVVQELVAANPNFDLEIRDPRTSLGGVVNEGKKKIEVAIRRSKGGRNGNVDSMSERRPQPVFAIDEKGDVVSFVCRLTKSIVDRGSTLCVKPESMHY